MRRRYSRFSLVGRFSGYIAILAGFSLCICLHSAFAEAGVQAPENGFSVLNVLGRVHSPRNFFDFKGQVVHIDEPEKSEPAKASKVAKAIVEAKEEIGEAAGEPGDGEASDEEPTFKLGDNPEAISQAPYQDPSKHVLPPDERQPVGVDQQAPGPFKGMATAVEDDDLELAEAYADQFVKYEIDLMYRVRQISQLIGGALVRQHVISDDDWVGVEQYLDYEFAEAREESYSPLKPTHEEAMKRIKPDAKGQAAVYFFFTVNCRWCREIAPEVERLWRVVQDDPNVNMIALTMKPESERWINSFRESTGFSMPVFEGMQVARAFGVGLIPAVVVVAPSTNTAYVKTGYQNFKRLYEFVRTVQGLPAQITPEIERLMAETIGEIEVVKKSKHGILIHDTREETRHKPVLQQVMIKQPKQVPVNTIERF